ncbi:hypothetical protein SNE40_005164 [Patella caerulea]|uniref:PLAT domain-containing protein n=1 Tax=Patella caerulea TaxID=87958 RepID=A0AAN8KAF3_PATCE
MRKHMGLIGVFLLFIEIVSVYSNGSRTCYPRLGCFSIQSPFNNTGMFPQDPGFIGTVFKLYTSENPVQPLTLTTDDLAGLNPQEETKVIIHGFMQDWDVDWLHRAATAFLTKSPVNVIVVGWGQGAGFPYRQAASNTRVVGAEVALMVNTLINMTYTSPRKIHLIGHSLGAHVAGYAGDAIAGLGRITGLDPAKPSFEGTDIMVRLDKTDARYVDVIHTDGSQYNTFSGYGMLTPVGHIDFYPNGGTHQPGCGGETYEDLMSSVFNHGFNSAENSLGCSHDRAFNLFIESITTECPFKAYPCTSMTEFESGRCSSCGNRLCPSMGLHSEGYKSEGTYYLKTSDRSPYCGYHYYIELKLTDTSYSDAGEITVTLIGSQGATQPVTFNTESTPADHTFREMVVSSAHIGQIQKISLTFDRAGYSFWGYRSSITVKQAMAHSLKNDRRVYFCQRKWIRSGSYAKLQNGSRHHCT